MSTAASTTDLPATVDIAIVGGGFSGLGLAIRLLQEGHDDFVVLERGTDVGGTWYWNDYPGCGCDVPSHLYSFSFAPKPDWSSTYARQPEIREYLRECADRFGVRPHFRFETPVESAAWDEAAGRWTVETARGTLSARVLVSATGPLFEPKMPDIPGLDEFEGLAFHSARWDHSFDPRGKRIAAIGTGASAIQFVPEVAPAAREMHVFQRTAPWVMPHPGRNTLPVERAVYKRFPALQRLSRGVIYAGRESLVLGFVKQPKLLKAVEAIARQHRRKQISDPALLEQVEPDYALGCKRILPSNKWYRALDRPNVSLHIGGVTAVKPNAVVASDGTEVEVDAIIFGTGFHVSDPPVAQGVRGRDGRTLAEHWGGSMRAHKGATVPGFPNMFLMLGPNTGLGHSSMVYMIESQIAYILDALRTMRERRAEVAEVRPETEAASNAAVDERLEGTVWSSGCSSWYADSTGRIAALWPDYTFKFRAELSRFDADGYELRAPEPAAA